MNERNLLIKLGIVIYILLSSIDRFVAEIPNYLYLPIAIIGIAMILVGMIKNRKQAS